VPAGVNQHEDGTRRNTNARTDHRHHQKRCGKDSDRSQTRNNIFIFPGGKPELGESPIDAAVREVGEELGVRLDPALLSLIGTFAAPAANEDGHSVQATVFEHSLVPIDEPLAEIEELQWIDPATQVEELAPLLKDVVFPILLAGSRKIQRLAVFTGSASGKSPVYEQAAKDFARTVSSPGRAIVYGGGRMGLIGTVADAARKAGGKVFGVMPQVLVDGELAHPGLTSLEVVPGRHARKHCMSELADGFVALPGGAGTLEELFGVGTWQQLGIHAKPVALLDVDGFWQPLLKMLDHMTDQGFSPRSSAIPWWWPANRKRFWMLCHCGKLRQQDGVQVPRTEHKARFYGSDSVILTD